jgi:hypothetical protein
MWPKEGRWPERVAARAILIAQISTEFRCHAAATEARSTRFFGIDYGQRKRNNDRNQPTSANGETSL